MNYLVLKIIIIFILNAIIGIVYGIIISKLLIYYLNKE